MSMSFDFHELFILALAEWPDIIDLAELQQCQPDLGRYSVKGLGLLSDKIKKRYYDREYAIIWIELTSAIYEVIHSTAKTITRVEKNAIRSETVRLIFERRLKKSPEFSYEFLGWEPEEVAWVKTYFSQSQLARRYSVQKQALI